VKKSDLIQVEGIERGRGRLKITLEVVKNDMLIKEVIYSMILDSIKWRRRIDVNNLD
jgi:hypothetical protein